MRDTVRQAAQAKGRERYTSFVEGETLAKEVAEEREAVPKRRADENRRVPAAVQPVAAVILSGALIGLTNALTKLDKIS